MGMLLGMLIGGWVLATIIMGVTERFSTSARAQPPTARATISAAVAFVIIYVIAGFGFGNGSFAPVAGFFYLPGIGLAWFFHRRKLQKAWDEDGVDAFS